MKTYINKILESVFGEEFREFMKEAYDKGVVSGDFSVCEQEYVDACSWFAENWSEERKETLRCIDVLQEEKRNYAGEYAFCCGMSAAFEQLFTERRELCFDYLDRLDKTLFEVEGMKGHPCYYNKSCEIRDTYAGLYGEESDLPTENEEEIPTVESDPERYHLTSHECGWEQRICSATVGAYYLGYRLSLEIIERIRPLATQRMMDQILMTEYQLGITLPATEREGLNRAEMKRKI